MQCAGLSGRLVLGQGRSRAATGALKAAGALKARASGALRSVAGAASPLWRTGAAAGGSAGGRHATGKRAAVRADRLKTTACHAGRAGRGSDHLQGRALRGTGNGAL